MKVTDTVLLQRIGAYNKHHVGSGGIQKFFLNAETVPFGPAKEVGPGLSYSVTILGDFINPSKEQEVKALRYDGTIFVEDALKGTEEDFIKFIDFMVAQGNDGWTNSHTGETL